MRTTIDLPDTLFKRLKAAASLKGVTLKKFIALAIEHEIERQKIRMESRGISLPLVPSKNPGSIVIDAEKIAGLLEMEDYNVSS